MHLLSVRKWLPSVRKWLLRERYLNVTFAKKFTKKQIIFGNQSGPSDVDISGGGGCGGEGGEGGGRRAAEVVNPFPDPGISIRAASAQSMRGGGMKIPRETAPGGFLVPRDRQSEESRAISGNFYRNGTFPHRSAASLRRPTGAADATLSRRTMPPVSSLLLSH